MIHHFPKVLLPPTITLGNKLLHLKWGACDIQNRVIMLKVSYVESYIQVWLLKFDKTH